MFERVRARGVSVFVSGQSDRSIAFRGLLQNAERILSSATTIILHACSHPHEILTRAGTGIVIDESPQVSGEQDTGQSSLRQKEVLNVSPNEVMQLLVGEAYVIAHGKAQRVRVLPIAVEQQVLEEVQDSFTLTIAPSALTRQPTYIRSTGLSDEITQLPAVSDSRLDEDLLN